MGDARYTECTGRDFWTPQTLVKLLPDSPFSEMPMLKLLAATTDPKTAREIQTASGGQFEVITCNVQDRAVSLLRSDPNVFAVVAEHVQGVIDALALLQFAAEARPSARRVMVSAYSDLGPIIRGLHSGAIQQVVHKPIRVAELTMAVGLQHAMQSGLADPERLAG